MGTQVLPNPRDIILRPLVSEKSMIEMQAGKYTFIVRLDATKTQVRQAIEQIFGVKVAKVNTFRVTGKMRRMGRFVGRRPSFKKAVVTLEPGQTIKFFEGMMERQP